jgi:hypothetical protein
VSFLHAKKLNGKTMDLQVRLTQILFLFALVFSSGALRHLSSIPQLDLLHITNVNAK